MEKNRENMAIDLGKMMEIEATNISGFLSKKNTDFTTKEILIPPVISPCLWLVY